MLEVNDWFHLVFSFSLLSFDSEDLKDVAVLRLNNVLLVDGPILFKNLLEASADIWISKQLLARVKEVR